MRHTRLIVFLILVVIFPTACGGATTSTAPVEPQEITVVIPTETEVKVLASPTVEPTKSEPTATDEEPTVEAVPTEVPADECLECHQDKDRLIDTAKPEEEVVSESYIFGKDASEACSNILPWVCFSGD